MSIWSMSPKKGEAKIVDVLSYPLTGEQCVDRIYTDLCIIELKDHKAYVTEMVSGLSFDELQAVTGCPFDRCTRRLVYKRRKKKLL